MFIKNFGRKLQEEARYTGCPDGGSCRGLMAEEGVWLLPGVVGSVKPGCVQQSPFRPSRELLGSTPTDSISEDFVGSWHVCLDKGPWGDGAPATTAQRTQALGSVVIYHLRERARADK